MSTNRLVAAVLAASVVAGGSATPTAAPVLASAAAPAPARPEVTCSACLVVVGDDVIWGREVDTPRPNASTTKMVTALVVARAADPADPVVASRFAAATGGGGVDLRAGDRYTVLELLHALLLSSSNDAAVALAEHVAGSQGAFVARMNAFVRSLGLRRSRFVTPHGLDVPGHYSTARDLARIALAVLRRPLLAQIVGTPEATIGAGSLRATLVNTNPLLETYEGAVGVKTGYTSGAGDVLVAAAERSGRRLIAVAMGAASAADDARALLDYGFAALGRGVLVEDGTVVGVLVFDPSGSVAAVVGRTVRGLPDPRTVHVAFAPAADVAPPLTRGETVGTVVVTTGGGEVVGRAPAVADAAVPDSGGGAPLLGALLKAAAALIGSRSW